MDDDDKRYWIVDDGDPEGGNFCLLDREIDQVVAYFDDEDEALEEAERLNSIEGPHAFA